MTVEELSKSCANMGIGSIKIINSYNLSDTVTVGDVSELTIELARMELKNWKFIHKRFIDGGSEFILEIYV